MLNNKLKEHIKQLVREMLDEESISGDAGAYLTPNAFSKKTNNKIATMYGMKLVKPKKNKSMNEDTSDPDGKLAKWEKGFHLFMKSAKKYKEDEGNKHLYDKAIEMMDYLNDKYKKQTGEDLYKKYTFSKVDEINYDKQGITEKLQQIIKEELLNEVTYNKFKNEVKFRTKNEMLHRGIREVKRKLNEVERLIEYTARMKSELSEDLEGVNYWTRSLKAINEINEISERISTKIKDIHQ